MADNASRRGAVNLGLLLMLAAFGVIGGFLFWLNAQAADYEATQLIEDEVPEEQVLMEGAIMVSADDVQLDASPFEGQLVTLAGLSVAGGLGTQGFWLEMPNRNPFLVAYNADLMAQGTMAAMGETITVTGTVLPVSDSVLNVWSNSGTITEGDRLAAEFATHFMEAAQILVTEGGATAGGEIS
jgi:hypothetical protein